MNFSIVFVTKKDAELTKQHFVCQLNLPTQSYLEPNRNRMQKPIGGLPEKIEGEVRIGAFYNQKNVDSQQKEYANDS